MAIQEFRNTKLDRARSYLVMRDKTIAGGDQKSPFGRIEESGSVAFIRALRLCNGCAGCQRRCREWEKGKAFQE